MSENILSPEDIRFLELLHRKFGLQFLRCDDKGFQINNEQQIAGANAGETHDPMYYLGEISRKLKFRLNSNFQLNLPNESTLEVVRL